MVFNCISLSMHGIRHVVLLLLYWALAHSFFYRYRWWHAWWSLWCTRFWYQLCGMDKWLRWVDSQDYGSIMILYRYFEAMYLVYLFNILRLVLSWYLLLFWACTLNSDTYNYFKLICNYLSIYDSVCSDSGLFMKNPLLEILLRKPSYLTNQII